MDNEVVEKLLALNRQFYQTSGEDFSATRMRLQPGVQRILDSIPDDARILDLGCGNGELAHRLSQRDFSGVYTGLDSSTTLLEIARERLPEHPGIRFLEADIAAPAWEAVLETDQPARFDLILAFSMLHHLPDSRLRQRVLGKVRHLIEPYGRFIHSEWQFLNSARLQARILPWEAIGLTSAQVETGDYLLDWRHGSYGLRYVHHFTEIELTQLAARTGFTILDTFYSDGGQGNLGLYQVWLPTNSQTSEPS